MILDYKNQKSFVTLIYQDVICFTFQQPVDQHSLPGIKPDIMIFTVLDFLRKIAPTSRIQSAKSR